MNELKLLKLLFEYDTPANYKSMLNEIFFHWIESSGNDGYDYKEDYKKAMNWRFRILINFLDNLEKYTLLRMLKKIDKGEKRLKPILMKDLKTEIH